MAESIQAGEHLRRHWFFLGLIAVTALTLGDRSGSVAAGGALLGRHHGPESVMFLVFLLSGLALRTEQVRRGLLDLRAVLVALGAIFVAAPLLVLPATLLPLPPGLRVGLSILAAMPTTLSTGVVMTGAAGGNPATALLITLAANGIGIVSVPFTLDVLLGPAASVAAPAIDRLGLMLRLATLVLLPLGVGLLLGRRLRPRLERAPLRPGTLNQGLVLVMVWIAVANARSALSAGPDLLAGAIALSLAFHGGLWAVLFGAIHLVRLGRGQREAVLLMGGQKTLPLAVLIQTTLFPQHGAALVMCVVHHLVHLSMDSYLVGRLAASRPSPAGGSVPGAGHRPASADPNLRYSGATERRER